MDWISKQAKLYRNLALTHRYQAIVHLEDQEDERFWDYQCNMSNQGVIATCTIARTIMALIPEDVNNASDSDHTLQTNSLSA